MKKAMVLFSTVAALFLLACITPPAEEDSGTRKDAGAADRGRADALAPRDGGGGGTWVASNYGKACTSGTQCPGGVCDELYTGNKSCWKKCTTVSDCSDFPITAATGGEVLCEVVSDTATDMVCIMGSPQLGPCGNPNNAACVADYGGLCGTGSSGTGFCVQVCNPHDPTNASGCRVSGLPTGTCGCQNNQTCSTTLLSFESGVTDDPDGICAATTTIGATCGINEDTWVLTPCTGAQECSGLDDTHLTGTCATPAPEDGGTRG